MPNLFRTRRLSVSAAGFVALLCAIAAKTSAQVPAPLLIGPDRVGSAVTYRLTTVGVSGPSVQTLALRWKLGRKVVVTLTSDDAGPSTPYVATRAADGSLTVDNLSTDDPAGQRIAALIGALNRLNAFVATAPGGATSWKTTLVVQPSAPPVQPVASPQSTSAPQALNIPVVAERSDDASGATVDATGSVDRTVKLPAQASPRSGGGGGGGGRGMGGGGGRMGGGGGGMGSGGGGLLGANSRPPSIKVTTTVLIDAHFGPDGQLRTGSIIEKSQAAGDQTSAENPPSTRSWVVDRTS
ncbi:MAG: hypothetical protein ABR975_13280 [Vulcanimicrobiaceae bacterium]|jgi:hypothetical protein